MPQATQKGGFAAGNAARTCKKLPVASFCASETAETGRIANGREQGDHVSRRRGGEKARGAAKDLIGFVRSRHCGELNRGLQNLESPFKKGFNFVCARLLFGCAESRFVEPRSSLRGSTDLFFSYKRKARKTSPLQGASRFRKARISTPKQQPRTKQIKSFWNFPRFIKPCFSAQKLQLPTAPKLTCSTPFRISLAAVSLQYNISFSKINGLAFALR